MGDRRSDGPAGFSLQSFVTRSIQHTYRRTRVRLALSQSLFSSYSVDAGTKLLLKSLADTRLPGITSTYPSILDLGCGVGVLGICMAAAGQADAVTYQDRDALAVAICEMNAAANNVLPLETRGARAMWGLDGRRYDLVVSNLPAKAGEPVHRDMVRRIAAHLSGDGLCAAVIIAPLARRIEAAISAAGCSVSHTQSTSSHAVYHFRPPATAALPAPTLDPYVRGRASFRVGQTAYSLDTAHNLPEFDTLSFGSQLGLPLLHSSDIARSPPATALVWNPGQGHASVILQRLYPHLRMTLASRDVLQLLISRRNLDPSAPGGEAAIHHTWNPMEVPGPFDLIVIDPDHDPGVPWHAVLPA